MRKRLVAGNWKMNNTVGEALALVDALKSQTDSNDSCEILVCPPFTALYPVCNALVDTNIAVGAQNMYCEEKGAFTGEVAPHMLKEIGVKYVIIGHSERRQIFKESDELINKKIKAAFAADLIPILCVGEALEVREAGNEVTYVEEQLNLDLVGLTKEQVRSLVIAYEPIWAIGTGRTATAEQAEAMCAAIREHISKLYSDEEAELVRIQYGGSVKGSNAKEILEQPNIDGALVGGASLSVEGFLPIVDA